MNILSSIKNLNMFEKKLWALSTMFIVVSFIISKNINFPIIIASLIGVAALTFVAKGDVLGQALTVVFSVIYAVISYEMKYYGEMITYLGMTMPIALLSIYTWLSNPYSEKEVEINKLSKKQYLLLFSLSIIVTIMFYYILSYFGTSNIVFSTLSISTSFLASSLMMLRSPNYALAYASNDIVLIVLWVFATMENIMYFPMIVCFIIFLLNDTYGYINWRKMELKQNVINKA